MPKRIENRSDGTAYILRFDEKTHHRIKVSAKDRGCSIKHYITKAVEHMMSLDANGQMEILGAKHGK